MLHCPSFLWAPCIGVCHSALRARVASWLQGYWLLSLFTRPTLTGILLIRGIGWNWTPGLSDYWLVVWLRLWQPWHTFRTSLNWTDVAWHSCFVTISSDILLGLSNLGLLFGPLIMPPLTPTKKCLLGRITSSLCNTMDVNSAWSLRNVTQYLISQDLNGVLQTNRMADKGLFIAACHHIIAVILVPSSYSLQTKQLVTHKPDEQSRKNKLCISPLHSYWL
jgi:hypothetical protein